ncbi:MAG TPA: hypothetical protein PLQ76_02670, partial [bacterium]|nr:hypothetical protein [bacterium]
MAEKNILFSESVETITKFLMEFSIQDIASSLFVSHLWLPNVSSIIKHQLLVSILASTDPSKLSQTNRIGSYADFSFFMKEILKVI